MPDHWRYLLIIVPVLIVAFSCALGLVYAVRINLPSEEWWTGIIIILVGSLGVILFVVLMITPLKRKGILR